MNFSEYVVDEGIMAASIRKGRAKHGIDITLLEANLERTPTERVLALQDAVALAERLRLAGQRYYAKLRKNNKTDNGQRR